MTEAMEELCSFALSWGMSWELYWYGEMSAVLSYYDKWKYESEQIQQRMDTSAWLIGVYVQKAVSSTFSKSAEYPQSPYYLEKLNQETVPEEEQIMRQFIQLDDWKRAFSQNFQAEKERT